jgi:glycine amidinotransferase
VINSHNSWSQLEEVWLGDVYPAGWYDHLEPMVRDVFQQLTAITQEDLASIQKTLESMDVVVRRPVYTNIDDYIVNGVLAKPQICPRDQFVTVGNTLWYHADHIRPWQSTVDQYLKDSASNIHINHNICINGANVVRVGRDIIIDRDVFDFEYHNTFPDYRVHLVDNGGHMDGCFAILKPGVILANHYFDDYHRTFPGWEIIMLDNPTYAAAPSTGYQQPYPVYNGKFYDTTVDTNRSFNDHIVKHALDWVGDYRETYFELNCLVINEQNVVMLAENEPLAEELARRNITVHWVPFRARSFWDGAMHCLTVDIRRQSIVEDFFPERELCRQ